MANSEPKAELETVADVADALARVAESVLNGTMDARSANAAVAALRMVLVQRQHEERNARLR